MCDKIRIVFVSSNPFDISRIKINTEAREISETIQSASLRDRIEFIIQPAARPRDLSRALLRHKPHILHFSGHGSASLGIIMEDENSHSKPVSGKALGELFKTLRDNLRVVVLNACYTARQAGPIKKTLDYTIGMQNTIGDLAAIIFSAGFYEALAFGRTVEESFELGRSALILEGIAEDQTPRLLKRPGLVEPVYLFRDRKPPKEIDGGRRSDRSITSRLKIKDSIVHGGTFIGTQVNSGNDRSEENPD